MLFLGGTNFYGKIDRVPGLFYVATRFSHVFYVPLIPMGTHLVVDDAQNASAKSLGFLLGGQKFRSVRLGFSLKSLLYAWAKLALVLLIVLAVYDLWKLWSFGVSYQAASEVVWRILTTILASLAMLWLIRWTSYASEARALELGRSLGFDDATILSHVRGRR